MRDAHLAGWEHAGGYIRVPSSSHRGALSSRPNGVRDTRADDLCTDGEKMTHLYKRWSTIEAYLADGLLTTYALSASAGVYATTKDSEG